MVGTPVRTIFVRTTLCWTSLVRKTPVRTGVHAEGIFYSKGLFSQKISGVTDGPTPKTQNSLFCHRFWPFRLEIIRVIFRLEKQKRREKSSKR